MLILFLGVVSMIALDLLDASGLIHVETLHFVTLYICTIVCTVMDVSIRVRQRGGA